MEDVPQPYKRFLVFGFDSYYPGGGQSDVVGTFDSLDEARARTKRNDCDHFDILDLQKREFVDA